MEITRLFDYLYYQKENYPQKDCFAYNVNGDWKKYSTDKVIQTVNAISRALIAEGIKPGDNVGIVGGNTPQWMYFDLGIMQVGAVNVPLYPTISSEEYEYILNDADVSHLFISTKDIYDKLIAIKSNLPKLKEIYTFEEIEGAKHWKQFLALGDNTDQSVVEEAKAEVQNGDLATVIYTSGTTGSPKGVMLSHNNILSNVEASVPEVPFDNTCKVLSFLPLNHVFERNLIYQYLRQGASVYFSEIDTIGANLLELKPHFFTCVPRLLEKVFDKIVVGGNAKSGIAKTLFNWALELALKYDLHGNNSMGYKIQYGIAKKLVYSKIAEKLGGNVIGIVSGSAPLQPRLIRFFTALGIEIMEGYGLTETSPIVCVNRFERSGRRIGTVGPKLNGVEVKLAEDGEILVKGPNVMIGYYKNEQGTAEVLSEDGWFSTGDIGIFEEGKFLKITDRKKQMFKTSGGKYICPQPIENKFKESPFIEQIMVVGEYQKFPGALFVPAFEALEVWAKEQEISYTDHKDLVKNPEVGKLFDAEKEKYNECFGQAEKIKRYALLDEEWTTEGKQLTPTMKVKRKVITQMYQDKIDEIYNV